MLNRYRQPVTIAVLFLGALLALRPVRGAELDLYVVESRTQELYDGNRRAPVALYRGNIIPGYRSVEHPDWLSVQVRGKTYQTPARGMRSLTDTRSLLARKVAWAAGKIEELSREIAANENMIEQLFSASQAILFDSAVQYGTKMLEPVGDIPAPLNGVPMDPQDEGPAPMGFRVRYTYRDRIPTSRARNRVRSWEKEIKELEEDNERKRDARIRRETELAALRARVADLERTLSAFRKTNRTEIPEGYVTIRPRVQLYDGKNLIHELLQDVVVPGYVNRDNPEWLRVSYRGQTYDANSKGFNSRPQVEEEWGSRIGYLKWRINDLRDETARLEDRRDLIQGLRVAMEYQAKLTYVPLRAVPFDSEYRGRRYYSRSACPNGVTEVVNQARAHDRLRDWDDLAEDIDDDMRKNDAELQKLRAELAGLEPRFEDIRRRFAEVLGL